jgi:hypothetical protein
LGFVFVANPCGRAGNRSQSLKLVAFGARDSAEMIKQLEL